MQRNRWICENKQQQPCKKKPKTTGPTQTRMQTKTAQKKSVRKISSYFNNVPIALNKQIMKINNWTYHKFIFEKKNM